MNRSIIFSQASILLISVLFCSQRSSCLRIGFRYHRSNDIESKYLTREEKWFNQTLDHFSPTDHRLFGQRYYEFLDYFQAPDGPIFLIICGESSCPGIANDYLSESLNAKYNRTEIDGSWFVFGVSYSGALSAWFRLKFPHLTCGSLASSAVVQAVYNFTDFDKQVGESAGPICKPVLQEITALVEEQLLSDGKAVKKLFGATQLKNDADFLYLLADAAATAFQYGNPDILCSPLIDAKKKGKNLVETYADYVRNYYLGSFGTPVQTYDQQHLKNTTASKDNGDRLWWFQVCSEVAYFQVAPKNDSIRSSKIDTKYHLDLCKNIFGEVYPDVYMTNIYYGGTRIAGSKIIFTNGSQDPWRHASKQKSSKDMPSYVVECHNCGHGSDLRGCPQAPLVIEGNAENCTSAEAVHNVRQKILENIDLWLSKCQSAPDDDDPDSILTTKRMSYAM